MRKIILINSELLQKLETMEQKVGKQDEKIAAIFKYLKRFVDAQEKPRVRIGY